MNLIRAPRAARGAGCSRLPDVVDAFHIVPLSKVMVDEVRRVQQQPLGHRPHKHDPLYGIPRLRLTCEERLPNAARVDGVTLDSPTTADTTVTASHMNNRG